MEQYNIKDLTRLETILLSEIIDNGNDGDFLSFTIDTSSIDNKSIKGVISSLSKKGLISIFDYEGKGKSIDNVIQLNDSSNDIQIILTNFLRKPKLFKLFLKGKEL